MIVRLSTVEKRAYEKLKHPEWATAIRLRESITNLNKLVDMRIAERRITRDDLTRSTRPKYTLYRRVK